MDYGHDTPRDPDPRDPDPRTTDPITLDPATAAIGDPSFTLHVHGTGFTATSVIVFAGQDEPTTFVSDTELTTGVDMSVWVGPDPAIPVLVRTEAEETEPVMFAFTGDAAPAEPRDPDNEVGLDASASGSYGYTDFDNTTRQRVILIGGTYYEHVAEDTDGCWLYRQQQE